MTDYTTRPYGSPKAAQGPLLRIETSDFFAIPKEIREIAAAAVTAGVRATTRGLTLEMRQHAHAMGLGDKLPNALRDVTYPKAPKNSLRAAGEVVPNGRNAWRIFDAMTRGVTIAPKNGGQFLALPTENCPEALLRARFREVSPLALEELYGRKLRIVNIRPGLAIMVMDDLVEAKSGRGFKKATKRRRAQQREVKSIVMFILVPHASLRARLQFQSIAERWADRLPELIDAAWPEAA